MSPKKVAARAPADRVALYEKLVATVPGIERKGAGLPYTSMNGNMFSMLDGDGTLALRLPPDARKEFIARYATKLHETYGTVMPEYVAVPPAVLEDTAALSQYWAISVEYARTLRPKPTTRPKR